MTIYPDEPKASLIERRLPPQNVRVPQLSRDTGIPKDTLYTWRLQAQRERGIAAALPASTAERWGAEEKFAIANDNPYSEAWFRTCKYRPDYPIDGFASLDETRAWMQQFVRGYNEEHRHSGIRFVTPPMAYSQWTIAAGDRVVYIFTLS